MAFSFLFISICYFYFHIIAPKALASGNWQVGLADSIRQIQDTRYKIPDSQISRYKPHSSPVCTAQKCKCKCARNFFRRRWQVNNKCNYNNRSRRRNYLIYNICSTNTFSIQYLFNGKHKCQQHQSKGNVLKQKINAKFVVCLGLARTTATAATPSSCLLLVSDGCEYLWSSNWHRYSPDSAVNSVACCFCCCCCCIWDVACWRCCCCMALTGRKPQLRPASQPVVSEPRTFWCHCTSLFVCHLQIQDTFTDTDTDATADPADGALILKQYL